MKETYIKPIVDISAFKTVDVITTSGDIHPGDNDTPFGE